MEPPASGAAAGKLPVIAGTALRAMSSQQRHQDAITTVAAKVSAETARSRDHGLLELLPTSRCSIGYHYQGTGYVVHPTPRSGWTLPIWALAGVFPGLNAGQRGGLIPAAGVGLQSGVAQLLLQCGQSAMAFPQSGDEADPFRFPGQLLVQVLCTRVRYAHACR